jgi:hypothetical protein
MVPLMKPSILADLDAKFRNCTYMLINDTCSHCFPDQVNNHHINNIGLVLTNYVEIGS